MLLPALCIHRMLASRTGCTTESPPQRCALYAARLSSTGVAAYVVIGVHEYL